MRKLVVIEFVTLDGVMQGLGSPDEDRDGGFEYGGWGAPYMDGVQMGAAVEAMSDTTAHCSGARHSRRCRPSGRTKRTATPWPPISA